MYNYLFHVYPEHVGLLGRMDVLYFVLVGRVLLGFVCPCICCEVHPVVVFLLFSALQLPLHDIGVGLAHGEV